jgi:TonB family protein
MTKTGRVFALLLAALLLVIPSLAEAQQWRRSSEVDEVEGTRRDVASFVSRRGSAVVRCQDGQLEAFVVPAFTFILGDTALVRFRFQGGDLFSEDWSTSTSQNAVFAPSPGYFARQLANRSRLALDVYDYNGTPTRVEIPLSGSGAAIRPVMERCGVPSADIETLIPNIDFRVVDEIDSLDRESARIVGRALLGDEYAPNGPVRPLELYRRFDAFYSVVLPEACQEEGGDYWNMPLCLDYRNLLKADPAARIPAEPIEALAQFGREPERRAAELEQAVVNELARQQAAQRAVALAPEGQVRPPECQEADTGPVVLRPFNTERAYPARAIEREQEGEVSYRATISETGEVISVEITAASPAGIFENAVQGEVRRMRFRSARINCENVPGTFNGTQRFMLD